MTVNKDMWNCKINFIDIVCTQTYTLTIIIFLNHKLKIIYIKQNCNKIFYIF